MDPKYAIDAIVKILELSMSTNKQNPELPVKKEITKDTTVTNIEQTVANIEQTEVETIEPIQAETDVANININSLERVKRIMLEDSEISDSTRRNYKFHMKDLESIEEGELKVWVSRAKSNNYKRQRANIANKIRKIIGHLPEPVDFPITEQNLIDDDSYRGLYSNWLVDRNNKADPINLDNLFIYWLPTRRRDIFTINIVDVSSETIPTSSDNDDTNYYCKSDRTFIYNNSKNSWLDGQQRLRVSGLLPIIGNTRYEKICEFLDGLDIGKIYRQASNTHQRRILEITKLTLQQSRHCWVTFAAEQGRDASILMAEWMNHDYDTAMKKYRI